MRNENPWIDICPGIKRQTVTSGKDDISNARAPRGRQQNAGAPTPQEQIVHILQDRMRLIVDGTPHELVTGASFYPTSNVPHGVETIEETRVLDTFSPPREEYLAIDEANRRSTPSGR
jgi:hypothetical protein